MTETTIEIVLQCKNNRGWHDAWAHAWDAPAIASVEMGRLSKKVESAYGVDNVRIIRRRTTVAIDVLGTPKDKS